MMYIGVPPILLLCFLVLPYTPSAQLHYFAREEGFADSYSGCSARARLPAMGWNSWNTFRTNVSASLLESVSSAMKNSLLEYGYQYVLLDDGWAAGRSADGTVEPVKQHFPGGMKSVVDRVHDDGLLFGIYSDPGRKTCAGFTGADFNEGAHGGFTARDAKTYAEWGVDYLKYDWCHMATPGGFGGNASAYFAMAHALESTGRKILFSLCNWGYGSVWEWGLGNSRRITTDLFDFWSEDDRLTAAGLDGVTGDDPVGNDFLFNTIWFYNSVLSVLDKSLGVASSAQPGQFNDMDMLWVGIDGMTLIGPDGKELKQKVGGMTPDQQLSHFALWCFLKSPLILGLDPRNMSESALKIVTNRRLIAVNQDPLVSTAVELQDVVVGDHVGKYTALQVVLAPEEWRDVRRFNQSCDVADLPKHRREVGILVVRRDVGALTDHIILDLKDAAAELCGGKCRLEVEYLIGPRRSVRVPRSHRVRIEGIPAAGCFAGRVHVRRQRDALILQKNNDL